MPRIGLAYGLTDDWVIRSGFGIYYNVHQLNNYSILNLNPPLSGSSAFANTISTASSFLVPRSTASQSVRSAEPDFAGECERAEHGQLPALRRAVELRHSAPPALAIRRCRWATSAARRRHLDNTVERNNPDPFIPTGATDTIQSRRPFPFIIDNGVTRPLSRMRFFDSGGNSWYEGLQVSVRKRYSHGFVFTLAYTYSKTLMEGYGRNEGDGINSNTYQNKNNRAAEKGRVGFDARHVLVSSFIYDIPAPQALSNGFAGAHLLWLADKRHHDVEDRACRSPSRRATSSTRAMLLCGRIASADGKLENPTINQWFNPDAFRLVTCANSALPELCHYGNAGTGHHRRSGVQERRLRPCSRTSASPSA